MPKQMYTTVYDVEGEGVFPFDMLRYDASYPHGDVGELSTVSGDRRRVRLAHRGEKNFMPTVARWNSFGWRVHTATLTRHKLDL